MAIVSVIVPVLNEEENIEALYQKLDDLGKNSPDVFEFIFVDDGSRDNTISLLRKHAAQDNRVRILRFSRNFGSHAACLAGLTNALGDARIFISADMQEPPDLIDGFIEQWRKGYDVVMGVREGPVNHFSKLYYFLVRKFALKNMPSGGTDAFLIDRKVAEIIAQIKEKDTSVFGLILWSGFRQAFVPYTRRERRRGVSKWTLDKKIKLFIDTFVSFSYFPIRFISCLGLMVALTGFVYAAAVTFNRLFFSTAVEGWTSLMVVLLLVSGVQMIMLGVLGEYLWRNFDETRQRPPFIIEERIGFGEEKER